MDWKAFPYAIQSTLSRRSSVHFSVLQIASFNDLQYMAFLIIVDMLDVIVDLSYKTETSKDWGYNYCSVRVKESFSCFKNSLAKSCAVSLRMLGLDHSVPL